MEGLFHWVNVHLTQAGIAPISSFSKIKTEFLNEPEEALKFTFDIRPLGRENSLEGLRESIWSEIFSQLTPGPLPHLVSLHPLAVGQATKKVICFDMDSTLIDQEVIDEIGRLIGKYEDIARVTELAMQGKIDFVAAFLERIKLFKGLPRREAERVIGQLTVSAGGEKLLGHARFNGIKTMVVSGGFQFILNHFKNTLYLDQAFGNQLVTDENDTFTGEIEPPLVDGKYKRTFLAQMRDNYRASREETVAVGDGANDVLMMEEAGLSVSFCGKPKLSAHANTLVLQRNLLWLKALI